MFFFEHEAVIALIGSHRCVCKVCAFQAICFKAAPIVLILSFSFCSIPSLFPFPLLVTAHTCPSTFLVSQKEAYTFLFVFAVFVTFTLPLHSPFMTLHIHIALCRSPQFATPPPTLPWRKVTSAADEVANGGSEDQSNVEDDREREAVTSWAQSELMEDGIDLVGKCELPQVRNVTAT